MSRLQQTVRLSALAVVAGSLVGVAAPATAAPATPAVAASATAAVPPSPVSPDVAVAAARAHVLAHAADFGLSAADVKTASVASVVPTEHNGTTNVYLQQRVEGVPVSRALLNVTVLADGSVLRVASSAVGGAAKLADAPVPVLSDVAAARRAAAAVGLTPTESFASDDVAAGPTRSRTLGDGGISRGPVTADLAYVAAPDGDLRLAWQLVIDQLDGQHWWQVSVDAATGAELDTADYVDNDGYDVYPLPVEAPSFGGRALLTNPATSALGWHDTNGVAGAESTLTTGNNVSAYTDTDNNNLPDPASQPDGGAPLSFDFALDLAMAPASYRPAAVTNLFYVNNRVHDVFARFGFNEAAHNFQKTNYTGAAGGGDAVNAEAQDGGGIDNANFATPPDGSAPRMQMYLWDYTATRRDGDLDNGVIVHEYGHGISNRLTGGGSATTCLENDEQAGEGWSDYFALMLTQAGSTEPAAGRGIGTYVLGQPTSGVGIRTKRYSTDLSINDWTYDTIKTLVIPHGVGSVWAEMLWDLTWDLVDKYGYTPDLITGNGGNARALQLVVDGLKGQPCSPGFVDARNAILAAEQVNGGDDDSCLIWRAFARRGLGYSASQGSSASRSDGVQAFDLPPACLGVTMARTATPDPVGAGRRLTYGFDLTNVSTAPGGVSGVSVVSTVQPGTTYVPGSATCAGTYDAALSRVTFPVGAMALGATRSCSFRVTVAPGAFGVIRFADDVEPDLSAWTATHASGTGDWALTTTAAHSPTHAAFGTDVATVSDQYLALAAPVAVSAGDQLSFWHRRALEGSASTTTGFDGGVVEVSTDGGSTWADLGAAAFTENGYSHTIATGFGSPIGGRPAFSGSTTGFVRSTASLAAYAGQSIRVRFRLATDSSQAGTGWWVDDVRIGTTVTVSNPATLSITGFPDTTATQTTEVLQLPAVAPSAPAVTGTTPGASSVSVSVTPDDDGGGAITSYGVECVSSNGGVAGAASGASPVTVGALSPGKAYACRARATNAVGTGAFGAYGPTVTVPAAPAPPVPPAPAPTAPARPTVTRSQALSPTKARITFTPGADGGSAVTSYTVSCVSRNGGRSGRATGSSSPIKVKRLTPGKRYRCTVTATNAVGTGAAGAGRRFTLPVRRGRESDRP